MILTCPPYADLERYSDDPRDLSAMDYTAFADALAAILLRAAGTLAADSYLAVVLGEVRGPDHAYRGLVPDVATRLRDGGLSFYNEIVYVTPIGSLPLRAGRAFRASRKLGKSHQNVLIFAKGDPVAAAKRCGEPAATTIPNGEGVVDASSPTSGYDDDYVIEEGDA